MKAPEVVQRYATTLLEAAFEGNNSDRVREDVEGLVATLDAAADLESFLVDRMIKSETKDRVLRDLFGSRVHELTLNFLLLLVTRRRISLVREILQTCIQLFDERSGVVEAEVRSAVELSDEQKERLQQQLSGFTGKTVRLRSLVDERIRGGMVARVGDTVFDGSLTTQLQRLHRQLSGSSGGSMSLSGN